MNVVGGVILLLIALFTGGCSLIFALEDLRGYGYGFAAIWGPGLLIAAVSGWGAVKLLSRREAKGKAGAPSPPPEDPPPPPPTSKW